MSEAFICDAVRTPVGRYGGALAAVRADDLGAVPLRALMERHPGVDFSRLEDVIYGCANQAGEDNRNVARMSLLLAGLPVSTGGVTVNRLCGSGMEAVGQAARAIKTGEADLLIAGGVESMSRAPYVLGKATAAYARAQEMFDTTLGWRFVNPIMKAQYGIDSMPETAENVAAEHSVSREDQDAFAYRSQQRTEAARQAGFLAREIVPVTLPQRKGEPLLVDADEHPRADTTLEGLASLKTPFRDPGTITAGNASGINDGACALLLASERALRGHALKPRARVVAMAVAGVEPRVMGIGPVPAARKVLKLAGLTIDRMDTIELNEAFAAQSLACLRELGLPDDANNANPNGGAIAIGHPLGMSGARLVLTALNQLESTGRRYGLCSMCIGVGQGIAMVIERM